MYEFHRAPWSPSSASASWIRKPATLLMGLLPALTACGDSGGGGAGAPGIDPNLVGNWTHTKANSLRASDLYCNLRADGTFTYSGASVMRPVQISPSPMATVTGRWKAKDGHLYSLADGQSNWIDLGPYKISGNSLLLSPPGGRPTYWER